VSGVAEIKTSYRRTLKGTSIIGGSSSVNIVVGVLRTKVLAVLLGPSGVGLAGLYNGFMGVASTLATMGLGSVGTRQIAEAASRNDSRAIAVARRALFWGTMVLACMGGLVVWSLRSFLAVHALGNASYTSAVGWLSLGVTLSVAGASQVALIQGMRRVGDVARLNVFGSVASTILGIALIWRWGKAGLVAYIMVVPFVSFILGHIYVSRLPRVNAEEISLDELSSEWSMLLRLGIAMVGAGIVQSLAQLWIRVYVAKILGTQALGQFQAAWTISLQYLTFVLAAMGTDYFPRLTGAIHDHKAARTLVNEQTEIAFLLSSPVLVLMMACAPWTIHLLYAASFAPAIGILRWQVLGDVLKVPSWPLGYIFAAQGDALACFWTEASGWTVMIGVLALLLPTFGLPITGIAYLAMYIFYLPLVYFLARRRIGFRWSRSVLHLFIVTLAISTLVGAISCTTRFGWCFGVIWSGILAVLALGRITEKSGVGGHLGRLGTLARRIVSRIAEPIFGTEATTD
jgi:O-antigen/teichoic acid export membrane protein